MPYVRQIVVEKANIINHNKKIYGTFAEIGAGQEVVSYFFKAGLASQTVAKSMSAYDMVFSDHIYGKSNRYVCEERLVQMLSHEYTLLQNRLHKTKGKDRCFFAFANTVSVSTLKKNQITHHHGWMGLRFQNKPQQKYNEILIHVNLKDRTRLQQYEILGVLGVNLIYTAFYKKKHPSAVISSLVDNFEKNRVDIDILKCKGPEFKNNHISDFNLELLKHDLTSMMICTSSIQTPMDAFYDQTVILHSEESLKNNKELSIVSNIQKQMNLKKHILSLKIKKYLQIKKQAHLRFSFIHRCRYWSEVVQDVKNYTQKPVILHLSIGELKKVLQQSSSKELNQIEILGQLLAHNQHIFVALSKDRFIQSFKNRHLINYLLEKKYILCL